jgi:hypothetical protein
MPTHFGEFVLAHDCPGVIVVSKKARIVAVIDELVLIWSAAEPEEFKNRIVSIA